MIGENMPFKETQKYLIIMLKWNEEVDRVISTVSLEKFPRIHCVIKNKEKKQERIKTAIKIYDLKLRQNQKNIFFFSSRISPNGRKTGVFNSSGIQKAKQDECKQLSDEKFTSEFMREK